MGLGPSKEKIRRILKESVTYPGLDLYHVKIEYYYKQNESMEEEEK